MTTITRIFNFSDEELFQKSSDLVDLMIEDLTKFQEFGIDQAAIDELAEKLAIVKNQDYDLRVLTQQKQASFEKYKSGEILRTSLFNLQLKSELAFKKGAVDFILVDLGGVSLFDLDELRNAAEIYIQLMTDYGERLSSFGISEQDVVDLKSQAEIFFTSQKAQRLAKRLRKISTQQRITAANSLYRDYSTYSNLGRQMWASSDPVRSSYYRIYSGSGAAQEPDEPSEEL